MRPVVVDFCASPPDSLGLPIKDLPEIPVQKRKQPATSSLSVKKMMGADTETIEGRCWLFSTEMGVWEVDTFTDLLKVLYGRQHASKWKSGRGDGRKAKRGVSTKEFFFWNLKFDVQSVLHFLDDETVLTLLEGDESTITIPLPDGSGEGDFVLNYLEGKMFSIRPTDWHLGQYKVGACIWWDISQFYGKQRLQQAAETVLQSSKVETCFDGTLLDVSRLNEPDYRDLYREDIETYAVQDAVLAGRLARRKRDDFVSQNIRFIRPYSLANVAQRNILDTCKVPTINEYIRDSALRRILQHAHTAYQGGHFETAGSGFHSGCELVDLTSAYPYVMNHLPDTSAGEWIEGDEDSAWWGWCEEREPYSLGFAEASILFAPDLPWYPLVKPSAQGTLVAPRFIRGWFTADELVEARKWPHSQFIIGQWCYFVPSSPAYPFRPFIETFYEVKMNSPKGSVPYDVAKTCINSGYGKLRQATNNKAGKLWNPIYAATVTGGTRARLAEINRLNDYSALSFATDGVVFPAARLHTIPPRPLPALHDLGEWDMESAGDLLVVMSGVYSMRDAAEVKTTFRGSASYHLRNYRDGGLFRFCEEHSDSERIIERVQRPWSAKEARVRNDFSLMNRFEERAFTLSAHGDSSKRVWRESPPRTFGDLLLKWWPSTPHRQIQTLAVDGGLHG